MAEGQLTVAGVKKLKTPGKYVDADGLMLKVVGPDQRYWMFRYRRGKRDRTMSLGNADRASLDDARKRRRDALTKLDNDIDPLEERRQKSVQNRPRRSASARLPKPTSALIGRRGRDAASRHGGAA